MPRQRQHDLGIDPAEVLNLLWAELEAPGAGFPSFPANANTTAGRLEFAVLHGCALMAAHDKTPVEPPADGGGPRCMCNLCGLASCVMTLLREEGSLRTGQSIFALTDAAAEARTRLRALLRALDDYEPVAKTSHEHAAQHPGWFRHECEEICARPARMRADTTRLIDDIDALRAFVTLSRESRPVDVLWFLQIEPSQELAAPGGAR